MPKKMNWDFYIFVWELHLQAYNVKVFKCLKPGYESEMEKFLWCIPTSSTCK